MDLQVDHLTRIVNVHWDDGLAVEFTGRPSYLSSNSTLAMNKVVISFWFRIPQATVDAMLSTEPASIAGDYRVLYRVVPLLMFGDQRNGTVYDFNTVPLATYGNPDNLQTVYGTQVGQSHQSPMQPSCIGVEFSPSGGTGTLHVHIQTANIATGTGLFSEDVGVKFYGDPNNNINVTWDLEPRDASYAVLGTPQYFGNSGMVVATNQGANIEIATNQWHHVLISWDLMAGNKAHGIKSDISTTTAAGTEAYSMLWCALDDVNYKGFDLPALQVTGGDQNGMLCHSVSQYAGSRTMPDAQVGVTFSAIPSSPLLIPAPATLLRGGSSFNANQMVEMAELQIFCDISLDTSVEENRRAFIKGDASDGGKLKPVDPASAERLLRKKPEVLLHGNTEWIDGENTGSGGPLVPTGEITEYTPEPAVGD